MNSAVLNQPARAAQPTRMCRFVAAVGICFVIISIGCNADPSCRRETALLRAEILDIEDKYAVLQSRYETTASELHQYNGQPIDQTMYGASSNYHNVILNQGINQGVISDGEIISDNGVYPGYVESYPTEEVIYGSPVQSFPQGYSQSYPQGSEIIVNDPNLQLGNPYSQDIIVSPGQAYGVPSDGVIINESIGEGILEPNGSPQPTPAASPNNLPLPNDTRNQRRITPDDFQLELPGQGRRTIPAIQASARLGSSRMNRNIAATNRSTATEIMVNRSLTSGQDVDNLPGDEGLNLLLQTRNANGQIVLQGGELTVSLIDPKQRQRIGFWRFLPTETELFFVDQNKDTDGILLHLPWDESVPQRPRLLVHVQFTTEDGRALTTSSDVLIKPPTRDYSPDDPRVINWTQSDALWGDAEGGYVTTEVESLEDSFQIDDYYSVEERQGAEDDWQQNGTYKRGAKFSLSNDQDYSNSRDYGTSRDAQVSETLDHPDQPKWRPVR